MTEHIQQSGDKYVQRPPIQRNNINNMLAVHAA